MTGLPPWLRAHSGNVTLQLLVQPKAKQTLVKGTHGDRLRVRVAAAPTEGQANQEIILYFSKLLGVPRAALAIISGLHNKQKVLQVTGLDVQQILAKIDVAE